MDKSEINNITNLFCNVYRNRGFITFNEIQDKLEEYDASLIETNHIMVILEEKGCKITDQEASEDLSLYENSYSESESYIFNHFIPFLEKEKADEIDGLDYSLQDYELGVLYYAYLRIILKLTKIAAKKHIVCLQDAYNIFLNEGEDKVIFEIQSAEYLQEICDDLKKKKVKALYKTAIMNYQYFLTKNRHHVIIDCEDKMKK